MKWKERITKAEQRLSKKMKPYFTDEDIELSQLWITDPISEVSDRVVLKEDNIAKGPQDIYLVLDGIFFTVGIEKDDVLLAKNCYESIQKRAFGRG